MTDPHFRSQMNRLGETFGASAYKPERIALLWREVKELSDHWLTKNMFKWTDKAEKVSFDPAAAENRPLMHLTDEELDSL